MSLLSHFLSRSRRSTPRWNHSSWKVNMISVPKKRTSQSSLRVSESRVLLFILTHICQNETFLLQGLCCRLCLNSKIPADAEVCWVSVLVSSRYWIWILNQRAFLLHRYVYLIDFISAAHTVKESVCVSALTTKYWYVVVSFCSGRL